MNFRREDFALTAAETARVEELFRAHLPLRHDPWGTSLDAILKIAPFAKFLFERYFRVSVVGLEKIPQGPAIFIANHGGQIPIDGLMLVYSLLMKAPKARLLRGMVERWVPSLPFIGSFFLKIGQIVGDQSNCLKLLREGQSVMVFPEGVKGSGKTIDRRYELQTFSLGFYRLAIESGTPILPVVLVGTEESYPSIANAKVLAKLLGAPYFPITPTFPFLGPLGLLPLPCKISICVLDPIYPTLKPDALDSEVYSEIEKIRDQMQATLLKGLEKRAHRIFTAAAFEANQPSPQNENA